jgi:hypothetical protein
MINCEYPLVEDNMAQKIWQVNFMFNVSPDQYTEAVKPLVEPISQA